MKFIIMAGGQGTKLWPISTDACPKQFVKLLGDKSLFQMNLEALLERYKPEDIYISLRDLYIEFVREQAPMIPEENYIIEPHIRRDSGPASCYAMVHMAIKHPDEVIMFYVQPVVVREPTSKYLDMIEGMEKLVKKHRKLATGGMFPIYPETGSDYLELGEKVDSIDGLEIYNTKQYVPMPKTIENATEILEKMKLVLHCNHSTWTTKEFFEEIKKRKPDWYEVSMNLKQALERGDDQHELNMLFQTFEKGRIELVTQPMYNEGQIQVVILPFKWSHITTWDDVYEYFKNNPKPKNTDDIVITVDSNDNLIIGNPRTLTTSTDLKDMIIINSGEAVFVCPRGKSGKINGLLDKVKEKGLDMFL